MGSNSAGNLAVTISASNRDFTKKVKESEDAAKNFGAKMEGVGKSLTSHFEGAGEGITSAFKKLLGGGLDAVTEGASGAIGKLSGSIGGATEALGPYGMAIGAVTAGLAAMATAIIGVAAELVHLSTEAAGVIDQSAKMAHALGMSTQAFMELGDTAKIVANASDDDVSRALMHLEQQLGYASTVGGTTAEALRKIGLSAHELAGMRTDEAFKRISDAMKHTTSAADRAWAGQQLFGRGVVSLAPMLAMGSAAMDKYGEDALKSGSAVTDAQAAMASKAAEAMREIETRFEGAKNTLALTLAPVIEALGDKLLAVIPDAKTMSRYFRTALHEVAMGVGLVVDWFDSLKPTLYYTGAIAVGALTPIATALWGVAEAVIYVHNKLSGTQWTMPEGMRNLPVKMAKESAHLFARAGRSAAKDFSDAMNGNLAYQRYSKWADGVANAADHAKAKMGEAAGAVGEVNKSVADATQKVQEALQHIQQSIAGDKFLQTPQGRTMLAEGISADAIKKMFAQTNAAGGQGFGEYTAALDRLQHATDLTKATEQIQTFKDQLAKAQAVGGKFGETLREHGFNKDSISKIFDIQKLGGNVQQAEAVVGKIQWQKQIAAGTEAIEKMRQKVAELKNGMPAAVAAMHLVSPQQIAEAEKLNAQITHMKEAQDAAKAMGNLHDKLNSLLAGHSADYFQKLNHGWTAAQLASQDAMQKQIKMLQDAKQIMEESRTPLQKYEDRVSSLNAMLKQHAINQQAYDFEMAKARKAMEGDRHDNEKVGATVREFTFRAQAQQHAHDPRLAEAQKQTSIQKQQLDVQKKQLEAAAFTGHVPTYSIR